MDRGQAPLSIVEAGIGLLLVFTITAGFAFGVASADTRSPQFDTYASDAATLLANEQPRHAQQTRLAELTASQASFERERDALVERALVKAADGVPANNSWSARDAAVTTVRDRSPLWDSSRRQLDITHYNAWCPRLYGVPDRSERMVESWTESTTARERVETIGTTLSQPRSANWVATQAEVNWDTAKKHLDSLVESGALVRTDDGQYVPDPTAAYFDRLRQLILENDKEELRGELEAIAERIENWRSTFDVDSSEELEATLASDLSPDAVQERRQALRRWENSVRSRDTIEAALRLYDDVQSLRDGVTDTVRLEGTG